MARAQPTKTSLHAGRFLTYTIYIHLHQTNFGTRKTYTHTDTYPPQDTPLLSHIRGFRVFNPHYGPRFKYSDPTGPRFKYSEPTGPGFKDLGPSGPRFKDLGPLARIKRFRTLWSSIQIVRPRWPGLKDLGPSGPGFKDSGPDGTGLKSLDPTGLGFKDSGPAGPGFKYSDRRSRIQICGPC